MPGIRILLDNNVPAPLGRLLRPHDAVHASIVGWHRLGNGDLIKAAQADDFAVMITCDRNIEHQQNLSGQPIAFIVLTTTHWGTVRENVSLIQDALQDISPGGYTVVTLPKPPRRRRPYNLPPRP